MQSESRDAMMLNKYFSSMQNGPKAELSHADEMEDLMPTLDDLDPDVMKRDIELELERLQVQEQAVILKKQLLQIESARKKNIAQNSGSSNRCIMPDGRIIVRNSNDRSLDNRDSDGNFVSGDSLTVPALQRAASRACVACGGAADAYCAQCALTPYCSVQCQRRDWAERHRAVCHNLARLSKKDPVSSEVANIPLAAPLRRPHSPATRDSPHRDEDGSMDRNQKAPAGSFKQDTRQGPRGNYNQHQNQNHNYRNQNQGQNQSQNQNGVHNQGGNQNRSFGGSDGARRFNRPGGDRGDRRDRGDRPMGTGRPRDQGNEEDWGNKNANSPATAKPTVNSSEPTTPAVISTEPTKPAVNSTEPTKPTVSSSEPTKPTVNSSEPTKPTVDSSEPTKPTTVKSEPQEVKPAAKPALKAPGTLNDVTPARKLVPKSYLVELLNIGDSVLLSVDANASDCRSRKDGFVCLSMHERFGDDYQALCDAYVVACEADKEDFVPKPGDAFSYFNAEDCGWYRARCLSPSLAALLDSCKLVPLGKEEKLRRLNAEYESLPEFCCLLNAKGVKVGDNLKCTLVGKMSEGFSVSIENVETGANIGDGEVYRWLPTVEYPAPTPVAPPPGPATTAPAAQMPMVPRPDLRSGTRVFLVDATEPSRVFVRPADTEYQRRYDAILQEVILYAMNAEPLKEPPVKGQTVIGKYDGLFYRALCKRTSVAKNKYMLEYIDFGNVEIAQLENLYACPPNMDLSAVPAEVSQAALQMGWSGEFSASALEYIQQLKDDTIELVLSLPSGAKSAASGSAACLTVAKSNESVNRTVDELCTPEWKKMELRGADVVESARIMFKELEHHELPANGGTLLVLDVTDFETGCVAVCEMGNPRIDYVSTTLAKRMTEYCNSELAKEPYLPATEEMCIAKHPSDGEWCRAVVLRHFPGATAAQVCCVDRGCMATVPVRRLRKMLPEFVRAQPALANNVDVADFPKELTQEMVDRAFRYMKVNEQGRGVLEVSRCERDSEDTLYRIEAKGLIDAMLGK